MAQVVVEKPVLFCGIWRPKACDDQFLRTISSQFEKKPGNQSLWRLTTEGLTIIVTHSESGKLGQTDQIPVQSLLETTVNRYNPNCLMTSYLDPQKRFNVIVCRCQNRQDATHIITAFVQLQKSVSGHGYSIDLKQPQGINWMLKTKAGEGSGEGVNGHSPPDSHSGSGSVRSRDGSIGYKGTTTNNNRIGFTNNNLGQVVVEKEEEVLVREGLEVDGRPCYNVGVQAELGGAEDHDDSSDRESTVSDVSYQSMQNEIHSLSNEVRDLKLLLEQTTGISAEELFKRYRGSGPDGVQRLVPVKRNLSTDSEEAGGERRVNFAPDVEDDDEEDFDMRSIGMQAGGSARKYTKRTRKGPARFQQHPINRQRAGSASSGSSAFTSHSVGGHPMAVHSPHGSMSQAGIIMTQHGPVQIRRRDPTRPGTAGSLSRASWHSSGGTVVRPIEDVYLTANGSSRRRKQLVYLPARTGSLTKFRGPVAAMETEPVSPILKAPHSALKSTPSDPNHLHVPGNSARPNNSKAPNGKAVGVSVGVGGGDAVITDSRNPATAVSQQGHL